MRFEAARTPEALARFVAVMREVAPNRTGAAESYVDWERQADAAVWVLALEDEEPVGAGHVVVGWHSPPGVVRIDIRVPEGHRRQGVGSALYGELSRLATAHAGRELEGEVHETDPDSLAWAERRGFSEVGRNSLLVLDLATVEPPAIDPPEGIEIVTWAERPDLARALFDVALEASPDIPGNEDEEELIFENWLSADMSGPGDKPEATFVALAADEVVGFAKFSLGAARPTVAFHDLTGVKRAWRGRGIAGALKRAQIAWAKQAGFERLETSNEVRNEPVRRLNARHGYRVEPGTISVRGPLAS